MASRRIKLCYIAYIRVYMSEDYLCTRVPVFIVLQSNLYQLISCNGNTEVIMYYVDTTVNNNANSANVIDNTTTTM